MTTEPTTADRLRETLRIPTKTNVLKLAESNVAKLRADRAALKATLSPVLTRFRKDGLPSDKAEIAALTGQIDAIEIAYGQALDERTKRREAFGVTVLAEVAAPAAEYQAEVARLLRELDDLATIAVEYAMAASVNGLPVRRVIDGAPAFLQGVRRLRQIAG
ncbi:hypothetical protein NKI15_19985 [Mesorhizobium sp. M0862]|uniref:hypothetical protein n=1 Tax=Mesorhizobium sp. M0862 TaxID=2957015 RepID=UPI00333D6902